MRVGWALVFAACVSVPRSSPSATEWSLRLSPASLGHELHLAQRITFVRGEEQRQVDAQLEIDAQSVRLAAVAMGQTVASLSWDGAVLKEQRSALVPDALSGSRILNDVQLALWPADVIRAELPSDYWLEEKPRERVLRLGESSIIASVQYDGGARPWARMRIAHVRYGYQLEIDSVELEP